MKNLKYALFLFVFSTFFHVCFSQKSVINFSSLNVETKSFSTSDSNDPLNDSIKVTFSFYVSDISSLDSLDFKYGKSIKSGDIISVKIPVISENNRHYLNYKGRLFEVIGNKVEFYDAIGKNTLSYNAHVSISGKGTAKGGASVAEFNKQIR